MVAVGGTVVGGTVDVLGGTLDVVEVLELVVETLEVEVASARDVEGART